MILNFIIFIKFLFLFTPTDKVVPNSIYDIKAPAANGAVIDFSEFKGKKILIFNAPIEGDNNPQYAELEGLYKKYKDNLVVVAFLADDFAIPPGSRKGGTNRPKYYNVSFPMAAKVMVKGDNMDPLFTWLNTKKYNNLKDYEVKWDFQKYLINEQGQLVAIFDPKIRANNQDLIAAIEKK